METIEGVLVARTVAQFVIWQQSWRATGRSLALVPTMGALHAGHLALITEGGRQADAVAVTIFVNPLQFGPREDLAKYPRQLSGDCAKCANAGAALVFAPSAAEMYPADFQTSVAVEKLQARWDGHSRPGHFAGVATVVLKLLNLAQADVAVFGEKDWQQLQIIRQMATDLHHPTRIIGAPIVREADGLALSSRNAFLSADERARAVAIVQSLQEISQLAGRGGVETAPLAAHLAGRITAAGGRIDYACIVDAATLEPVDRLDRPARALVAAWFGTPKLLDNWPLDPRVDLPVLTS
ncbi:MAG: pantoate--beta-alanine ligase [Myxococcales bacterium]|nr:pantoate--beta-alanine ligase [Myxococcales bacterium]